MSRTIRELVEERSAEIFGRTAEKAALLQTLEEGGPLVVFVHGIAGVGKSTLLGAFAGEARSRGETVVRSIAARSSRPNAASSTGSEARSEARRRAPRRRPSGWRGLGERVVLVLDTYEVLRLLDSWVRRVFAPALRDNTRLVVAGREPPIASWYATPGWSELVRSVRLGNLDDGEAGELLARAGLDAADCPRVNRLARGHPLSLELAAAAVRARPDVALDDIALQAVLDELTGLYLDGLDGPTRAALDAASVVRRITLRSSRRCCPIARRTMRSSVYARCPSCSSGTTGCVVHDTIRETVARALRGFRSGRHRRYRPAAWRKLRSELPTVPAADLWRYTADMLYLVETPAHPRGVLPDDRARPLGRERDSRGRRRSRRSSSTRTGRGCQDLLSWWDCRHRVSASSAIGTGGCRLLDPVRAGPSPLRRDRGRSRHTELAGALATNPVPRGQRVLFNRRWLSDDEGSGLPVAQAACWLDIKRAYMEIRPELRRIYATVTDIATYAPVTPLGFVGMPDASSSTASLPLRAPRLRPVLRRRVARGLAARELLIEEDSLLDAAERQLVLEGTAST